MPNLTIRTINAAKPRDKDYFLWDEALPSFGLRIKPSGVKSFVIQYRNRHNGSRRMTIGRYGVLSPERARQAAKKLLASVQEGADPASDRSAARTAPTVAELADQYMERHARPKKRARSAQSDASNLRLHALPALGKKVVTEVTRAEITDLHHSMRDTPGAANRVLALLSKMFNLAEKWGLRPDGTNPCRHVDRYAESKMERFLSDAELARLGKTMAEAERTQTESASVISAIRLLIFTGARLGEILDLTWEQVDFQGNCLRLRESKSGPKLIYLNPPALEVLQALERREDSDFVIPGRLAGRKLAPPQRAWHRIRARAGLEGVRLHDLRHSFASVGAARGLSLPMLGALLGHTQSATTERYAHLSDDPVRQASRLIGEHIASVMKGGDGEVVALPGRK